MVPPENLARRHAIRDAILAALGVRYNQNHDPKNGQFAEGDGGGDGDTAVAEPSPFVAPVTAQAMSIATSLSKAAGPVIETTIKGKPVTLKPVALLNADQAWQGRGDELSIAPKLLEAEASISNKNYESGYAWGPDGSELYHGVTQHHPSQVVYSEEQVARTLDGVVTHNHPGGTSFSDTDINLAIHANVAEVRAVTKDGFYSMRRPANGWPSEQKLDDTYSAARSGVMAQGFYVLQQAPKNRQQELETRLVNNYQHYIWLEVASRLKLPYAKVQVR